MALGLPWFEIAGELWKIGRKVLRGLSSEGIYEVLEYETTLELHDRKGMKATLRKHEKVRYLQNHVIAYQDQAWGDGEILIDYRCSPGFPVDFHRPGRKTVILISLRDVKNRGDTDEFNFEWEMQNGFLREKELWETEIRHKTRWLKVQLIFPKARPPLRQMFLKRCARERTP